MNDTKWTLVVVESPYAGDVETNTAYLRACMADCLRRGEAPFASHALYTQPGVLDDEVPEERARGIEAAFAWGRQADVRVFYVDRGMSSGMERGLEEAQREGQRVVIRHLGGPWADRVSVEHVARQARHALEGVKP